MKPRQLALLRFLLLFSREHGYAPSLRDMQEGTGIPSNSVMFYNLGILRQEGYVTKAEYTAQGVVLTEKGRAALEGEEA